MRRGFPFYDFCHTAYCCPLKSRNFCGDVEYGEKANFYFKGGAIVLTTNISFKHGDQTGKSYRENLIANGEVINTSMDSDTAVAVDDFCRALTNLTTDNYAGPGEVVIATSITLGELMEEG